jgi:curved DNA-binding protein CbpA
MGSTHLPHSRRPVDYYLLLGVSADATFRDVEQAYWQATKTKREQLPKLNEAYEVLGDANRRAKYDAQRVVSNAERPKPTGPETLRPNPDRNKLRWYLQ